MKIDLPSIEKRQPPKPDIYCCTVDGTELHFELVEVVDSGLARVTNQQDRLQRQLAESGAEDGEFRERFSDSLIALAFQTNLSMQRRRSAVPRILPVLKSLPVGFEGNVNLVGTVLASELTRLHVERGEFVGPCFHVDGVTSFSGPTLNTVSDKLRREYPVRTPLHLLAYYVAQPIDAGTKWQPDLEDHIRTLLGASAFEAVWLFQWGSGKIVKIGGIRNGHGS